MLNHQCRSKKSTYYDNAVMKNTAHKWYLTLKNRRETSISDQLINAQTWCTTADFYDEEASDRISMKLTKKQRNETAQGSRNSMSELKLLCLI